MTKLSDTQLIVLSSAAKHDDGLATRPNNLNAAAASKVASSLISKGLVREIRAKADAPLWHENHDGRLALKITKAGREAIGVEDEETQDAGSASAAAGSARSRAHQSPPRARTRGRRPLRARKHPSARPLTTRSPRPANSAPAPSRRKSST